MAQREPSRMHDGRPGTAQRLSAPRLAASILSRQRPSATRDQSESEKERDCKHDGGQGTMIGAGRFTHSQ